MTSTRGTSAHWAWAAVVHEPPTQTTARHTKSWPADPRLNITAHASNRHTVSGFRVWPDDLPHAGLVNRWKRLLNVSLMLSAPFLRQSVLSSEWLDLCAGGSEHLKRPPTVMTSRDRSSKTGLLGSRQNRPVIKWIHAWRPPTGVSLFRSLSGDHEVISEKAGRLGSRSTRSR